MGQSVASRSRGGNLDNEIYESHQSDEDVASPESHFVNETEDDRPKSIRQIEYDISVVFVGKCNVGKSSLIKRMLGEKFDLSRMMPTLGAEFYNQKLEFNDIPVTFTIWDTSGQERFYEESKRHWQKARVIVQVYDVTDRSTFEAITTQYLDELEDVEECSVVLVIGNKADLAERSVSFDEGQEFAQSNGFSFIETSTRSGLNCTEISSLLASELKKKLVNPQEEEEQKENDSNKQNEESMMLSPSQASECDIINYTWKNQRVYRAIMRTHKQHKAVQVRVGIRIHNEKYYMIVQPLVKSTWNGPKASKHELKSLKSVTFDVDRKTLELTSRMQEPLFIQFQSSTHLLNALLELIPHVTNNIIQQSQSTQEYDQFQNTYIKFCRFYSVPTPFRNLQLFNQSFSSLTRLQLRSQLKNQNAIKSLAQALRWTCKVVVLDLSENAMNDDSAQELFSSLQNNYQLRNLILEKNEFGALAINALCDLFESDDCMLSSLSLSHNPQLDENLIFQIIQHVNVRLLDLKFTNCNLDVNDLITNRILKMCDSSHLPFIDLRYNQPLKCSVQEHPRLILNGDVNQSSCEMFNVATLDKSKLSITRVDVSDHKSYMMATYDDRIHLCIILYDLGGVDHSQLESEMNILLGLKHSKLIPYRGLIVDVSENNVKIASDQYFSENLSCFLKLISLYSSFTVLDKLNIIFDISDALSYLHSNNTCHGNLTSSTVLLKDKRAILTEYGLSKSLLKNLEYDLYNKNVKYASPERILGAKPCEISDVYAFGILVFEIWFGVGAYDMNEDREDEGLRVASTLVSSDGAVRPKIPSRRVSVEKGVDEVIVRIMVSCWSQSVMDRPRMEQVKKDVSKLIAQL
ncbi:Ras-related protein Rab [Acrasis kona]|uniref:Ras-related protein Rab n=1 Tax=Acrasis kona TaxID=1008807 RepID=A0AAW2ZC70_9EUKA